MVRGGVVLLDLAQGEGALLTAVPPYPHCSWCCAQGRRWHRGSASAGEQHVQVSAQMANTTRNIRKAVIVPTRSGYVKHLIKLLKH